MSKTTNVKGPVTSISNSQEGDAIENDLSIVIPAYNEEEAIACVLLDLKKHFPKAEIIVIDDGSSDGTFDTVKSIDDIILVKHDFNRGYGAALKTGMSIASRSIISWFDADNEMRPEDLVAMVKKLKIEKLAAVLGRRSVSVNLTRSAGKRSIIFLANLLGLKVGNDINCGLRVFRRSAILPYLSILPDGFSSSTTSTMIMAERGYATEFYDVETKPRIGESKVRLIHGFEAMAIVVRTVMLFAPLRIFLGLGIPTISIGLIYSLIMVNLVKQGLPPAGAVLILGGILFCLVGLLADQISQIRLSQLRNFNERRFSESYLQQFEK